MALTNEQRNYFRKIRENMNKSVEIMKSDESKVLQIWEFIPLWSQQGVYAIGDPVRYNDYPYKCITAHNAAHYSWTETLWQPYHGTSLETALPYTMPGGHGAYQTGEYAIWNGKIYMSKVNNNTWDPDEYPQGWELVANASNGGGIQGTIAHAVTAEAALPYTKSVYMQGEYMTEDGKVYKCLEDDTIHPPTVAAVAHKWELVE